MRAHTPPEPIHNKAAVPTGTITFAFTDIEGSTQRWERDRIAMEEAVRCHDALVRGAIVKHGGYIFKTVGDAFCAAFFNPADAVAAMLDSQRALAAQDFSAVDGLRVRGAIHIGTADEREGDYFGPAVNRVARLLAIGHGGQVLVSGVTADIVQGSLPSQASLRDLGEHRLKDLTKPERVYELNAPGLADHFAPLRSLSTFATNLPLQLTPFVGRERENTEISSLIYEHRLVTLVGAGGVGKTRTALQVAANLLDGSGDGVWFIELAPLTSGDYLPATVAQALGITLGTDGDPLQNLVRTLKSKHVLLIFDNCEHLVESCARVIAAILADCPKVRVLASSRQALEIAGEQTYRLPSLGVPKKDDVESLRASDAMQSSAIVLFVDRAAAADTRFTLTDENAPAIAEMCRRLDGIPLAIELAASKTAVLSLKDLSQKLDERFRVLTGGSRNVLPRQQTLRALIDWSFDLLDENERVVFRRLSVFVGGWTLQALSIVCQDGGIDEWHAFNLHSALISKSLVVLELCGDGQRYRMLNSIQDYSRERLEAANEAESVTAKHFRYYADLVLSLASLVESLEDVQWQHALAPEVDNIRAALDWAIFRGNDSDGGLLLLAHLQWPELIVTPQEAIRWFDAASNIVGVPGHERTKARVLSHHVRLEWLVGRPIGQREESAKAALIVARASSDPNEIAQALANLGNCYRGAGRFDEAEPLFVEACEAAQTLSSITLNAVLRNWAITSLQRGDVDGARRRFTEVAAKERPGSEAHASALLNLGELEFAVGNLDAARTAAALARETFASIKAAPLGLAVCNLAAYAMAADDFDEARSLLREAVQLLKRSGARWMNTALEHHAVLAGLVGDHERAAALLGFTDARRANNEQRQRTERHGYERLTRLLSEIFDRNDFQKRMSAGARLMDEQALEYATAITQHISLRPAVATVERINGMGTDFNHTASSLDAQGKSIDELHQKLAASPGVNKERLQMAVDKYKAAHQQFRDDALECMN